MSRMHVAVCFKAVSFGFAHHCSIASDNIFLFYGTSQDCSSSNLHLALDLNCTFNKLIYHIETYSFDILEIYLLSSNTPVVGLLLRPHSSAFHSRDRRSVCDSCESTPIGSMFNTLVRYKWHMPSYCQDPNHHQVDLDSWNFMPPCWSLSAVYCQPEPPHGLTTTCSLESSRSKHSRCNMRPGRLQTLDTLTTSKADII